ncbi:hypothetical protein GRI69_08445 [Erythrobacter vulgaris]|uniref:Uncharacterized protein n=1 Tax=Qipengyuania vulgaris TaxID=291985 RepID=A0A844XT13_9SPHN|nr:hypothetical protein [Qipengyuania vulgaris]MXO48283.1 hypothetical protein [Qipengyuania vulgaris]
MALVLAFVGPLTASVVYSKFFREDGLVTEIRQLVFVSMASLTVIGGALLLNWPFDQWPRIARRGAFAILALAMVFAFLFMTIFVMIYL